MLQPSDRLQQLDEGVFQELALEKRRLLAAGKDIIDLSVGSPDFAPPSHVVSTLQTGVTDTAQYGYAITGLAEFSDAVAKFYGRYGVELQQSEILQLMGSQDGLAHLALALINPGDVVLLPDPGYPIYEASIRLSGGTIYPLPIHPETLHPDFDAVPTEILHKSKMMILNYPSNPTAGIATREMFEYVIEIAKEHEIFIVHDFAYSEMIYDQHEAVSILSIPSAKDIAVEFNSLSKTFNMAGCRIGYLVGNENVIRHLKKLKSHIDYGVFLPIQRAAIAALTTPWSGLSTQRQAYEERRDAFCEALGRNGWDVRKPKATMFLWAKLPVTMSSYEFALTLIREAGVVVTPGLAFGKNGEGYVRMAIVQDQERLVEAADRIGTFIQKRG